jgi:hypothetical protein
MRARGVVEQRIGPAAPKAVLRKQDAALSKYIVTKFQNVYTNFILSTKAQLTRY